MKMRCNHPSQVRYSEGIHSTLLYIKRVRCRFFVLAVRRGRPGGVWPGGLSQVTVGEHCSFFGFLQRLSEAGEPCTALVFEVN